MEKKKYIASEMSVIIINAKDVMSSSVEENIDIGQFGDLLKESGLGNN